jgi:hypothetical protein
MTLIEILMISSLTSVFIMALTSIKDYIANKLLIMRLTRVLGELKEEESKTKAKLCMEDGKIVKIKKDRDIH